MSGGSYNYLCHKEPSDLFENDDDLVHMCNRLSGLGYADEAAKDTIALHEEIRQTKKIIQEKIDKLKNVWHAVEWWDSGDSAEDYVKKELDNYNLRISL